MTPEQFEAQERFMHEVHSLACEKGFYDLAPSLERQLLLILDEFFEYAEASEQPSRKIPALSEQEEELADIYIRLLDAARHHLADTPPCRIIRGSTGSPASIVLLYRDYRASTRSETTARIDAGQRLWELASELVHTIPDVGMWARLKHEYNKTRPHKHGKRF